MGPHVGKIGKHQVAIVTTNYDRAIEFACSLDGVRIDDGFNSFDHAELAGWKGIADESEVKLIKLHGSTDWYQGTYGDSVYKLRHPMPLYGDLFISGEQPNSPKLRSALVLPSQEKRAREAPYPELTTAFGNAARNADVAIFVGTSLRDVDVRNACNQCSSRVPTFLVSPTSERTIEALDATLGATPISQTASEFLISTLPHFLEAGDIGVLQATVGTNGDTQRPVLEWVATASRGEQNPREACNAIDNLSEHALPLGLSFVEGLLRSKNDDICKYSLALVRNSPDKDQAVKVAEEVAAKAPGSSFASELDLLKQLEGI